MNDRIRPTPFAPLEVALLKELAELLPADARPLLAVQYLSASSVERRPAVTGIVLEPMQAPDAVLDDDWAFVNVDADVPLAWIRFIADSREYLATFWATEGRIAAIEFDRDVAEVLGCERIMVLDREALIDPMQLPPVVASDAAETEAKRGARPQKRRSA